MLRRTLAVARPEVLLLVFGLLVVPALVLGAEVAFAFFGSDSADSRTATSIDELHRYSERDGWEPKPGRYAEAGRIVTINEDGYRGSRLIGAAPPERRRVLVIGDSIAFGLYVADHETYAALLDAGSTEFEVANLAVQGYGPDQSLLRLEHLGLALDPDVVVLAICLGNDFADVMLDRFLFDGQHPKPYFRLAGDRLVRHDEHLKLGTAQRAALWLRDRSHLYRALAPARGPIAEPAEEWTERRSEAMRDHEGSMDVMLRLIVETRDLAVSRGARFLTLVHPDRDAFPGSNGRERPRERWRRALTDRLASEEVEFIDLGQEYSARGLTFNDVAIDGLGHLRRRGHAETAAILEARLRREPR